MVERKIRDEFCAKGGLPVLDYPIYFFLGRNAHFESHPKNRSYVIRLDQLPAEAVSFTYGDSMYSLNEDYRTMKGEGYLSELCSQIYTLAELPELFSHNDFQKPSRLPIEAQLWIAPPSF